MKWKWLERDIIIWSTKSPKKLMSQALEIIKESNCSKKHVGISIRKGESYTLKTWEIPSRPRQTQLVVLAYRLHASPFPSLDSAIEFEPFQLHPLIDLPLSALLLYLPLQCISTTYVICRGSNLVCVLSLRGQTGKAKRLT